MLGKFIKTHHLIIAILAVAVFLRVINFSFPSFTSDEARTGYRAFTLSHFGKDELGRNLPLVFNSLTDYQLPLTSYVTAIGVFLFGKNDFGARIVFTLTGIGIVFLGYKIGEILNSRKKFAILTGLILASSPVLIFISKIPNDLVILTFLTMLIFYLQLKNKSQLLIILIFILSLLTSKFSWMVMPPFMIFNLWFYQKDLDKKKKIRLTFLYILLVFLVTGFFIKIPQFGRSLMENIFLIFSDTSIQPAVNRLRGQGIESGWPPILEKLLFNKLQFITVSLMHWFSAFNPGIYFGQFDKTGLFGFTQMGALAKVLIIPFCFGVSYLLRKGKKEERVILIYFLIFTFPLLLSYPKINLAFLILTIPFAAFVTSYGLMNLKKIFLLTVLVVAVLEVFVNTVYISPEIKNTNDIRPDFVKEITDDVYEASIDNRVVISDNIISDDIIPFVQWYHLTQQPFDYSEIVYPYKFRQSKLEKIETIGSETSLPLCKSSDSPVLLLSDRDISRSNKLDYKIIKIYKDSLSEEIGFVLKGDCPLNVH